MVTSWPVYFLTRTPSHPGRRTGGLKAGDPFPWQDKHTIKRMGSAFGVLDAIDRRFCELDYCTSLNVPSEAVRLDVLKRNLNLQAVRALLNGSDAIEDTPAPAARVPKVRRSAEVSING